MLSVRCTNPECRRVIAVDTAYRGETTRCPVCKEPMAVPMVTEEEKKREEAAKAAAEAAAAEAFAAEEAAAEAAADGPEPEPPPGREEAPAAGAEPPRRRAAPKECRFAPFADQVEVAPRPGREDLSEDAFIRDAPRTRDGTPTLGPIALKAAISHSTVGRAYFGEHMLLGREVVVKVPDPDVIAADPDTDAEMLLREVRGALDVRSPNVVLVRRADTAGRIRFIVQEYVRGMSARQYLDFVVARKQQGGLDEREALAMAGAACKGLKAAHAGGILHGDVKPANILLPARGGGRGLKLGSAKLSDFGLARALDATLLSLTGRSCRTPLFVPPECARRDRPEEPSRPADVYGMGVTLYNLLTNRFPFHAGNVLATVMKICNDPPTPITDFRSGVSDATKMVIARCLEKEPENRYADGEELLQALEEAHVALTGRPIPPPG